MVSRYCLAPEHDAASLGLFYVAASLGIVRVRRLLLIRGLKLTAVESGCGADYVVCGDSFSGTAKGAARPMLFPHKSRSCPAYRSIRAYGQRLGRKPSRGGHNLERVAARPGSMLERNRDSKQTSALLVAVAGVSVSMVKGASRAPRTEPPARRLLQSSEPWRDHVPPVQILNEDYPRQSEQIISWWG